MCWFLDVVRISLVSDSVLVIKQQITENTRKSFRTKDILQKNYYSGNKLFSVKRYNKVFPVLQAVT